jgi:membrane associated rhomboid family serine protease
VAFWAHVGGFVTGFVIIFCLRPLLPRRPYRNVRGRQNVF